MNHSCNLCEKQMYEVNDIEIKGFMTRGWRCKCGNVHSHPGDIDALVKFFRYMKLNKEISVFKSGNSLAIRIPKQVAVAYKITNKTKLVLKPEKDRIVLEVVNPE